MPLFLRRKFNSYTEISGSRAPRARNLTREIVGSMCRSGFGTPFVPLDDLDEVLTEPNIERQLSRRGLSSMLYGRIYQEAKKIYAILLLMSKDDKIPELLADGLTDDHLPLHYKDDGTLTSASHETSFPAFGALGEYEIRNFLYDQWCFLSPVLDTSGRHHDLHVHCALPFTRVETLNTGTHPTVNYKCKVHPAHQRGLRDSSIGTTPIYVAVTEVEQGTPDCRQLVDKLKLIGPRDHPNLLKHLVTYHFEPKRTGVVFPWMDGGTLQDLWNNHEYKPSRHRNCPRLYMWALRQMAGLTSALKLLHECNYVCCCVQPADILLSREYNKNAPETATLMLRPAISQHNRLATNGRYVGPEFGHQDLLSPNWDTWSMGCVFLDFVVWLLFGTEMLRDFRTFSTDGSPSGFCHIYNPENTSPDQQIIHDDVCEMISNISIFHRSKALRELVKFIDQNLLRPQIYRANSSELHEGPLPQSGYEHRNNSLFHMPQMAGFVSALSAQGPSNHGFHGYMAASNMTNFNAQIRNMSDHDLDIRAPDAAQPASGVNASPLVSSQVTPASSAPNVKTPVSSDSSESNKSNVSTSHMSGSPYRAKAPVAPMSPVLEESDDEYKKKFQAYIQQGPKAGDVVAEDSDSLLVATSKTPSVSSSIAYYSDSDKGSNEKSNGGYSDYPDASTDADADADEIDSMDVEIGRDAVVPVGAGAPGSSTASNINQSLRINNTNGTFHLGPQWQSPAADAARQNAGPEFGQATTQTTTNPSAQQQPSFHLTPSHLTPIQESEREAELERYFSTGYASSRREDQEEEDWEEGFELFTTSPDPASAPNPHMEQLLLEARLAAMSLVAYDMAEADRQDQLEFEQQRLRELQRAGEIYGYDGDENFQQQQVLGAHTHDLHSWGLPFPLSSLADTTNGPEHEHEHEHEPAQHHPAGPVDMSMSGARQPDASPFWWDKE
ncbi:hypothetical protein F5Y08DRAFT_338461 [Xylaria arbuscula]|nr:hypothetical protein F5Y08DRAFT_338461 [Xylaria arbuscula]